MLELATGCCVQRRLAFCNNRRWSGYLTNGCLLDLRWSCLFRCLFGRWVQVTLLLQLWCHQELLQLLLLFLWINNLGLSSVFRVGVIVALSEWLLFLPVDSLLPLDQVLVILMLLIDLHAFFYIIIGALMNERTHWLRCLCSRPHNRRSIRKISIRFPLASSPLSGMTEQPLSLIIICLRASRVICLNIQFLKVIWRWLMHRNAFIAWKVAFLVPILLQVAAVLICVRSLINEVWLVGLTAELLSILHMITTLLMTMGLITMIGGRIRLRQ